MNVNGIGQNYYQNYVSAMKNTKNVDGTDKADRTYKLSETEEMEIFKKEFYDDLSKITVHNSLSNVAVNISEAAFKAMKDDPEYREKILSLLQRDMGSSVAPRNCSAVFTVGATLDEYRGDSWPVGYDSEFHTRSKNSFYKRTSEKEDKQKESLEEYLEKQAQIKKQRQKMVNEEIAKMEREKFRLSQSWNNERQMAKAIDAYRANAMTEMIVGGGSPLTE